jgi:DNA-binding CsgD family transcriptional regulator
MARSDSQPALTRREREVLIELCRPSLTPVAFNEPASTRDIASALFVTEAAVKQHLLRLYDKLELHDEGDNRRRRLANIALSRGLVTAENLGAPDRGSVAAPVAVAECSNPLVRDGHQALGRRAFREAAEILGAADVRGELRTVEELAALGEAALWAGMPAISQGARQRAYQMCVAAGDEARAGVLALGLVVNFAVRLKLSASGGWMAKAQRHLDVVPEGREHALLAATKGLMQVLGGDLEGGHASTLLAMDLGRAHGDRDALALGQAFHATVLVRRRSFGEANALFDEAMASASSGELGPLATGLVFCRTICACLDVFDVTRALEWTEIVEESRVRFGEGGFPGDCRAHRASIFALRGEWSRARAEAQTACMETQAFDLAHTGLAAYELGELLLRGG